FLMEGVLQKNKTLNREIITCAVENDAAFKGRLTQSNGSLLMAAIRLPNGSETEITIRSGGLHNLYNALSAAAAGFLMGLHTDDIRHGLSSFEGVPMRLELREINGSKVICDFYNANPASMSNAVKELARLKGLKKGTSVAILGDMLELGAYAERYHRELGRWMVTQPVDVFIAVGPLMRLACDEFNGLRQGAVHAADAVEAGVILRQLASKDMVLIKGSRGLKMERVLE
ncbi:MAG: hypothetical protein L7F77_10840, partial [Candidatus Magnetominusculus sp. LBB02]|nr:hypothetical protein [Candidatus Magnetominusculus sp. LBB02]